MGAFKGPSYLIETFIFFVSFFWIVKKRFSFVTPYTKSFFPNHVLNLKFGLFFSDTSYVLVFLNPQDISFIESVDLDCFVLKPLITDINLLFSPITELASEYFGSRIRIGRPMRVQGLPQALQGSQFSAIIGLAIEISNLQDEVWDFEIPTILEPGQRLKSAVNWLKENW